MHAKVIGLVAHTGKPGVGDLINSIVKEFDRFSISILLEKDTAAIAGKNRIIRLRNWEPQLISW